MSQPTGQIQSMARSVAADRSGVILPLAWLETGYGDLDLARARSGSAVIPVDDALRGFEAADEGSASVILFGGAGADDANRLESMLRVASSRGARTYVLAAVDSLSPKAAARLARSVGGQILFRRAPAVPCTALLCDRGVTGAVFLGPGAAARWCMPLTKDQGGALFRAALHLFWHEASDEGWLEDKSVTFQPPMERPFDAPTPGRLDAMRFARVSSMVVGDQIYRPEASAEGLAAASVILVQPDGAHSADLAQYVDQGSQVIWSDLGLPPFSLAGDQACMTLGVGEWSMVVALSAQQRVALRALVAAAESTPDWRLNRSTALGSIRHRVWLPDAQGPGAVHDDVRISCGSVVAETIRGMSETEPESRPAPPTLGRHVTWTWQVVPPRLPGKSKVDPVIEQWAGVDGEFEKRCAALGATLEQVEAHQGTLSRTVSRLKSALLGLGRAHKRFASTLAGLREAVPSGVGPDGARRLLLDLGELEDAVEKHQGEVTKAEERARLEEEEEKQRHAYAAEQAKAKASIEGAETSLAEARSDLAAAEAALTELEAPGSELTKSERRARRQKAKADQSRAEKHVRIAESTIKRARETLEQAFTFVQPKSLGVHPKHKKGKGPRFVPQASAATTAQLPYEALPAVGALRVVGQSRYLAIGEWSELEVGEREAERLSAKLVAKAGD